jgi:hypothetical protein
MPYIIGSGTLITPESPSGVVLGVVVAFFAQLLIKLTSTKAIIKLKRVLQ